LQVQVLAISHISFVWE